MTPKIPLASQFAGFSNFELFDLLKVVSATFLLVCFLSLKKGFCETTKKCFYFTAKVPFNCLNIK